MKDKYANRFPELNHPAVDGFEITPHDDTVFDQPTRALYVGTGGTVTVMMAGRGSGNTILSFTNVANGTFMPLRVQKVYANTTASGIVGLF